jgi:SAM-dependent methyltransferase
MGLADLGTLTSLLICPRCGCELVESERGFRCSSPPCIYCAPGAFPLVGRWPVLVDFEQSIVQRPEPTSRSANPASQAEVGRWSIDRVPAWLRGWWKPPNQVAARNVELLLSLLPGPSPLILVIGGGSMGNGTEALYADPRTRIIGFDIYGSPLTQFIADAHQIPLASESVDAVLIQAVLEHVLHPDQVVSEIRRTLRSDGLVYAETPFLQQVHAGPYDFIRYTSSGHRYLFRAFDEIAAGPVAGPGTQLLWSTDHLMRGLLRSELAGKLIRALFFWFRYLDRLVPPAFAMDSASAYYFLGRRSGRELAPNEIVGYYRGAQQTTNKKTRGQRHEMHDEDLRGQPSFDPRPRKELDRSSMRGLP